MRDFNKESLILRQNISALLETIFRVDCKLSGGTVIVFFFYCKHLPLQLVESFHSLFLGIVSDGNFFAMDCCLYFWNIRDSWNIFAKWGIIVKILQNEGLLLYFCKMKAMQSKLSLADIAQKNITSRGLINLQISPT